MTPQSQPRKTKNSSKVNLLISFVVHAALVIVVLFFAAQQGWLGEQAKKISVQLVKEKPPEKPKEEPKPPEPPKEIPKPVETPKIVESPKVAPPAAPPTVAPANTELPSFDFDGGKMVETSSDPVQLYKGFVEYALRSKWNRPENIADDNYVAEIELSVDHTGNINDVQWKKNSGDSKWDESVQEVFNAVKNIGRPPPTNFPPKIIIRFDVQQDTEPVLQ